MRATSHARVGGRAEVSVVEKRRVLSASVERECRSHSWRFHPIRIGCIAHAHPRDLVHLPRGLRVNPRFSLIYEYSNLEYEHIPVEYRVHQAEHVIHIRVAASQEYVNTYSTRRVAPLGERRRGGS